MIERTTDFDTFWKAYPRKVGKLAAQKAYRRARSLASPGELLAGVEAYIAHKPAYADFCHPATWLNQGRWMDDYGAPAAAPSAPIDWFEECKQIHGGACGLDRWRHHNRKAIDAMKAASRAAS